MERVTKTFFLILFTLGISSCGIKLNKNNLKYIPYKGNEILVFQSNLNENDTVFLTGFNKFNGCYDPLRLFQQHCEGYTLSCTRSDPNYNRYLNNKELISILASSKNATYITFDIKLRYSWFYGKYNFSTTEFDEMPITKLTIEGKTYEDVKIFEADGSYDFRDNYVERFYWSVTEGFLGLDKRDRKWRLIKKYVL